MTTTTDNAKGALIDSLNGLLADSFALYIKTKNFHWHVSGPQFRDLHFEGFERKLSGPQRDSIMNSLPARVVRVRDREGNEQEQSFFVKAPYPGETNLEGELIQQDLDRMYTVVQDTSLVLVQRHLFDRIVPALDDLR